MAAPRRSQELCDRIAALVDQCGGNVAKAARVAGMPEQTVRNIYNDWKQRQLAHPDAFRTWPAHQDWNIHEGSVIIASDAHVWPMKRSVSAKALIAVTKEEGERCKGIIANGDFLDGARINRFDPDGWNRRPSVKEEIEGVQDLLHDWMEAAPSALRGYTIGNHEKNFERRLVKEAKEFEGIMNFRLQDHFPLWPMTLCVRINWNTSHPVMVKHRQANGVHAGYNNVMKSGVTMVTGHTHLLEAKPFGDYRGRRWGVQTGCLTPPDGPQFEYAELGYASTCEGFAVLTWVDGELMSPELCEVRKGKAWFRGKVYAAEEEE